jgi:hypothetical protein
MWVGINLYFISNQVLIKLDQLKLLKCFEPVYYKAFAFISFSPEGDLVFWGKPSYPLTLLIRKSLHLYSQLGCWACKLKKELGNPF